MKKFNGPMEKAGEWLGGTDEGTPRWWIVLKVLVGAVGVLVYAQLASSAYGMLNANASISGSYNFNTQVPI